MAVSAVVDVYLRAVLLRLTVPQQSSSKHRLQAEEVDLALAVLFSHSESPISLLYAAATDICAKIPIPSTLYNQLRRLPESKPELVGDEEQDVVAQLHGGLH